MKTQQLIINAVHRLKLDLRANISFCDFIYIDQVHQTVRRINFWS